ncbi:hypothetical protein TNCV_3003611 [Trichonephila clavipes]|nr:hypothetical protein TNCV_3003611 [Trichonephila clavipes]
MLKYGMRSESVWQGSLGKFNFTDARFTARQMPPSRGEETEDHSSEPILFIFLPIATAKGYLLSQEARCCNTLEEGVRLWKSANSAATSEYETIARLRTDHYGRMIDKKGLFAGFTSNAVKYAARFIKFEDNNNKASKAWSDAILHYKSIFERLGNMSGSNSTQAPDSDIEWESCNFMKVLFSTVRSLMMFGLDD